MNRPPDSTPTLPVTGFILAGGRSSRFGSNKVLAEWNGRPLLDYSLQSLRDAGIAPRVVTSDPSPLQHLAADFLTTETPNQGPLEAVRAALEAAATPWSLILTADMPGVSSLIPALLDTLARTEANPSTHHDPSPQNPSTHHNPSPQNPNLIHFRDSENRPQPFPALYHRSLLSQWENLGPRKSMLRLLELADSQAVSVNTVPELEGKNRLFWNVNKPRDLDIS